MSSIGTILQCFSRIKHLHTLREKNAVFIFRHNNIRFDAHQDLLSSVILINSLEKSIFYDFVYLLVCLFVLAFLHIKNQATCLKSFLLNMTYICKKWVKQ